MLRRFVTPGFVLRLAASLTTGLLLACAFPLPAALAPMEGASAAWLALVPLLILIRRTSPRAACAWGGFSGLVFWLASLVWLLQLRQTWGYLPVVVLAWVALSACCALYTGAFAGLLSAVSHGGGDRDGRPLGTLAANLLFMLAAPCVWVAFEYLRAVLFTGFPWNALGVSQYGNLATVQLAAVGGVYAVSALIVFLNAALAGTALSLADRFRRGGSHGRRIHLELMLGLAACAGCWMWGVATVRRVEAVDGGGVLRVACVQPCIPQLAKWDPDAADDTYRALAEQSRLALLGNVDLLIWPETAVPEVYRFDPVAESLVLGLVTNGVPLLFGSMDVDESDEPPRLFNSAFLIDTNGAVAATYRKQHLVPFGEYLPFGEQVGAIKRLAPLGFNCTPGDAPGVFSVNGAPVAVLICFEDTISGLARRAVRAGARVLVNLTNDAWFDGSSAARQHLAHAVFRAVEHRVPLVRCTNTGMTAFVTPAGRLTRALWDAANAAPLTGFAIGEVSVPVQASTPYTRVGDFSVAIPALVVSAGLFVLVVSRRKDENARPWTNRNRG